MNYRLIATGLVASLLLMASMADACSCVEPMPPKIELGRSNAVFTGKVTKIEGEETLQVTLEVASTWKGVLTKTVVVETARDGATCGFHFEVGKSYLVYAYLTGEEGAKDRMLATNICTRTRLLDDRAKPEVAELGAPDKTKLTP